MKNRAGEFRDLYLELRISDQAGWYDRRAAEYRDAHQQAVYVRNGLIALAGLLGVVGQIWSGTPRAALGVVAAVLAALAGTVAAYDALLDFPKLQKLYSDVSLSVTETAIDWADPPAGIGLAAELARAEKIFATENGQWGQLVLKSSPGTQEEQGDGAEGADGAGGAGHGGQQGGGDHGPGQAGAGQAGAGQAGAGQADDDQAGLIQPGSAQPGSAQPDTGQAEEEWPPGEDWSDEDWPDTRMPGS